MFGHHHHRHHHHHHRHHQPPLLGVLGGIALGATAVALATPPPRRQPVYIAPAPVIIQETPEQIAAKLEAQRIRDEARKAELERQRIENEKRRIELEKQRIEKIHLEDKVEEERVANFKIHLQLVIDGPRLSYEELKQRITALPKLKNPIDRFRSSPCQGLPKDNDRSIFEVIFYHHLYDQSKKELLELLLINPDYQQHAIKLFQYPLFNDMYLNPNYLSLLTHWYYNKYINSDAIHLQNERTLWGQLIHYDNNSAVVLFSSLTNRDKQLQMVTDWINSRRSASDVMAVYETIKSRQFNLNQDELDGFNKIAKQKILKFEIDNNNHLHPNENNRNIQTFINTHRSAFKSYFPCLFSTRSKQINEMIQNRQTGRAQHEWNSENEKVHRDFYRPNRLR